MKISGSCHCGKIAYRAVIDPELTCICNCTDCQKLSGSAFRTVAVTEPGAFELLSGTLSEYEKTGDSGNVRVQTFCPNCGSPIYSVTRGEKHPRYGIRAGTIAERNQIAPRLQIWCRSAAAWLDGISSLPRKDRQ